MEKKGCVQGSAAKRDKCCSYKLPDYKFSAEDKKYQLFIPKVTLKKEVLNALNYNLRNIFDMDLTRKQKNQRGLIYERGYFKEIPVCDQFL